MSIDLQTVVANALTLNTNNFVNPALQGLSDADLLKRPSEQCNPIGWLLCSNSKFGDQPVSGFGFNSRPWIMKSIK
jgi:hypothetical protein